MESSELRRKFLDFFKKKGHVILPSASLIPENDPTALFTTAGMHPLTPFLLGEKHPAGKRLANCQKCIRTTDIEEVGDDTHLTFFEMLGNWSLGDYWKKEAIHFSFEFLTKELQLPLQRLAVSCFAGDEDAPRDEESAKIWQSLGISSKRIVFLPKSDNWWGPVGESGPCGPDTEIFYWKSNSVSPPESFDPVNKNWVEIWNNVFMEYIKDKDGRYYSASQKNVDTGMGLERALAVLNNKESVYETDVFFSVIEELERISKKRYEEQRRGYRIIADHLKASVFLIAEEVSPSNVERGYILRRLLRRMIRYAKIMKISLEFDSLVNKVIEIYQDVYPELLSQKEKIINTIREENERFEKVLISGLKKIESLSQISGRDAFDLYQTYGFPIELTQEIAKEKGLKVDIEEFKKELQKHQEISRTASAGMFKGGLADSSEKTIKLHTAAHIMLAVLREVLGNQVVQKGSNITPERLRFDFSYGQKLTPEQLRKIEERVNEIIEKDLPVWFEEMSLEEAIQKGAVGAFTSKYGEKVKVYFIGKGKENVSKEICGGPHVERTGVLGRFRIIKEESSSAGVRRIKAVLE